MVLMADHDAGYADGAGLTSGKSQAEIQKILQRHAATGNAGKIRALLEGGRDFDHADLYRTIVAGPTGQRRDLLVGRVYYRTDGTHEFEIHDPRENTLVGYATRAGWRQWSITEYRETRDCSGSATPPASRSAAMS
jgi:hypothetical protein